MLADSSFKYKYLDPGFWFDKMVIFFHWLWQVIFSYTTEKLLHGIFIALAMFFIALIIYCIIRMLEIRTKEHHHLAHELAEYAHHQGEREKKLRESVSKNERWLQVLDYLASHNVNDWKLAIIEADSMLESLMADLGFKGVNIGERLKNADREKFRNLTLAWEAHLVRNRIAHEGAAFQLSLHEARRVAALYEAIFREFAYI